MSPLVADPYRKEFLRRRQKNEIAVPHPSALAPMPSSGGWAAISEAPGTFRRYPGLQKWASLPPRPEPSTSPDSVPIESSKNDVYPYRNEYWLSPLIAEPYRKDCLPHGQGREKRVPDIWEGPLRALPEDNSVSTRALPRRAFPQSLPRPRRNIIQITCTARGAR